MVDFLLLKILKVELGFLLSVIYTYESDIFTTLCDYTILYLDPILQKFYHKFRLYDNSKVTLYDELGLDSPKTSTI